MYHQHHQVSNPGIGWPYVSSSISCGTSFACYGETKYNFGEGETQNIQLNNNGNTMTLWTKRTDDSYDNKEWTMELQKAPNACFGTQDCATDWRAAYCNAS